MCVCPLNAPCVGKHLHKCWKETVKWQEKGLCPFIITLFDYSHLVSSQSCVIMLWSQWVTFSYFFHAWTMVWFQPWISFHIHFIYTLQLPQGLESSIKCSRKLTCNQRLSTNHIPRFLLDSRLKVNAWRLCCTLESALLTVGCLYHLCNLPVLFL